MMPKVCFSAQSSNRVAKSEEASSKVASSSSLYLMKGKTTVLKISFQSFPIELGLHMIK